MMILIIILRAKYFLDILPLRDGEQYIFTDLDPRRQNVANPNHTLQQFFIHYFQASRAIS